MKRIIQLTLALLLSFSALAEPPCEDLVCVEEEKAGDSVTFYAVSKVDGVSVSFSVSAINMKPVPPPMLVRNLNKGRTKLMTLHAIRGKKPQYSQGIFWEWGFIDAKHDDRVSYRLPYESRQTFRMGQGPYGSHTHQTLAAYDFYMPLDTPVCAARGGMVIEIVDGFGEGGPDLSFAPKANRVVILHDDGTLAAYLHLLKGTMRVANGDRVEAGTVIAHSGNSGRSFGPHLHFEVFHRVEGPKGRQTFPVKFHTKDGDGVVLEEGKSYRAE